MKNQKLNLTEDPIPYLIIKMAVPVSIGFFFHTMFNVVDTYFASQMIKICTPQFFYRPNIESYNIDTLLDTNEPKLWRSFTL